MRGSSFHILAGRYRESRCQRHGRRLGRARLGSEMASPAATGEDIDIRLPCPPYIREHHWSAVSAEYDHLQRSLQSSDGSQELADVKCEVGSIARIVLDVNGTPAETNASFSSIVAQVNSILKG